MFNSERFAENSLFYFILGSLVSCLKRKISLKAKVMILPLNNVSVWRTSALSIFTVSVLSHFKKNEKRVPMKPLLGDVGSVAPLHYCT